MSRHRNSFVSGAVRGVAVIYGSTYVANMTGHSSPSSSVGSRRTLAEEFQCDTRAIHHSERLGATRSTHPPRILSTLTAGVEKLQRCPF